MCHAERLTHWLVCTVARRKQASTRDACANQLYVSSAYKISLVDVSNPVNKIPTRKYAPDAYILFS